MAVRGEARLIRRLIPAPKPVRGLGEQVFTSFPFQGFLQLKIVPAPLQICLALSLTACSGSHLSVDHPVSVEHPGTGATLRLYFPPGQAVEHQLPFRISGGIPPYESAIIGCPGWVTLFSDQEILAGTAPEGPGTDFCTYSVTEADPGFRPPRTVTYGLRLEVSPVDRARWRFTQRNVPQRDITLEIDDITDQILIFFEEASNWPEAMPESGRPALGTPVYLHRHLDIDFDRLLVGGTSTHRYQVLFGDTVDDTLCIDIGISFRDEDDGMLTVSNRIRDDAYQDGAEFHCPPSPLQPASGSGAALSNPVHTALAPVHARHALNVAHGVVRDRVHGWISKRPRGRTAIMPKVGIASLLGESEGFDYSGSSESLSIGTETGAGSWQAGLVGSFTRAELHYQAAAGLAGLGYRSGEHTTDILSLHPFAAWHMASGGHLWASLGAGMGQLRHRDDLGFFSWSRSDVRLRTHAVGGAIPVADLLSGELRAEAGIESFAFEIEGGDRISSSLPTMRGRDWRTGLTWSAPIRGAPSISVAYKHLTGDGPEGGQLEARGFVSVEGVFDPRLTVTGNVEGSFGFGDDEHASWGLGSGIRFAPDKGGRGLTLHLDTRLMSLDDGGSSDVGIQGEAGYSLWSGPYFGTVRPYVGLIRYSSDGSLRRALGVDLRNTPESRVNVELHDQPRDRVRALRFTLRHRF